MNKEPAIGELVVVPKEISGGWYGSYKIYEVLEVVNITAKRREVKLSNGIVLKPNYNGEYDCLEHTKETRKMAMKSIEKHKIVSEFYYKIKDYDKYVTQQMLFDKLSVEQLGKLTEICRVLDDIVEFKKEKENVRHSR